MGIHGNSNAPAIQCDAAQALTVEIEGVTLTMEQLDWMQFYMLCRGYLLDNQRVWRDIHKTLSTDECDEWTKWSILMELMRFHVVVVRGGMLVKAEKERKQAA